MMKFAWIYLLICCLPLGGTAQEWRDSLNVARKAYEKQEYGKAYRYYRSAQSKAPEDIDLSDEMGQSAYKSQQYEDAADIYTQKASSETNKQKKAADYHNLGNTRMRQSDYEGAVDAYKESLRNNPTDEQTRYNLSEAMRELKNQQQQNGSGSDDQNNQNNQNNNQNNQQNNQNQQGNNQQQSNQSNSTNQQSGNSNSNSNSGKNAPNGTPKLQDKAVDKKLDELMKQEAETKRKLGGSRSGQGAARSGKDW